MFNKKNVFYDIKVLNHVQYFKQKCIQLLSTRMKKIFIDLPIIMATVHRHFCYYYYYRPLWLVYRFRQIIKYNIYF